MSRGLGKLQRAILAALRAAPDGLTFKELSRALDDSPPSSGLFGSVGPYDYFKRDSIARAVSSLEQRDCIVIWGRWDTPRYYQYDGKTKLDRKARRSIRRIYFKRDI